MKAHLLVVDDDIKIGMLLKEFLSANGYIISLAKDTGEADDLLSYFKFDLIILDYMLPGENGTEFLARIRKTQQIAVIMLTALGEKKYVLEGLEQGADDYLLKPFEPKELLLRIKNLLKRTTYAKKNHNLLFGKKRFELETGNLFDENDNMIKISSSERNLLLILADSGHEIISREQLIEFSNMKLEERTIDVQIKRLRDRIEEDSANPRYLQTIRGRGYRLHYDE